MDTIRVHVSRLSTRVRVNCRYSFLLALILSVCSGVSADDTDLFFSTENVRPNILFVLDTSGSMDTVDEVGEPSRIDKMKDSLTQLLSNLKGINVGIMTFDSEVVMHEPIGNIVSNRQVMQNVVNGLTPGGSTRTIDALWSAHEYFRGDLNDGSPAGVYTSPIEQECQENHVVLLTDGNPTADADVVTEVESVIGTCAVAAVGGTVGRGTCGAELGQYMNATDHSDALYGNNVTGLNNVVTHTIGFNFSDPWLSMVSGNTVDADGVPTGGFGRHFTVSTADALQGAFSTIIDGIDASFAVPTISLNSFNESRHRDELFFAMFQSSESVRWNGNIKKYKLTDGEIVDADGTPIVDENGVVDPNTRSLWADLNDGGSIPEGGFAHELPDYDLRHWYTDYNSAAPVKVTTDNFATTLPPESLGAADDIERDELALWAIGADVEMGPVADVNDATAPPALVNSNFVGDSLHNSPTLLSYWATSTDPATRKEILFSANNLGVLHAIDAETGIELWSYTPEEHLGNIKSYFDNATTRDHVYGIDGQFTLHTTRTKPPGYLYQVEDAWLYMTERRGGNRVYALDVSDGLTDPENGDPFSVMWKITGGTDGPPDFDSDNDGTNDTHSFADLGQTWSKPQLITVGYDCPGDCKTKELLMFGGGYNPDYDDRNLDYDTYTPPASGHGNAVYFVDPETGSLEWSVGNGAHHSLDLPIGHSVPSTPVTLDTDLDGSVDVLFFNDISGDVWRVDFDLGATDLDELHKSGGQIAELSPAGQSMRFFNPLDVAVSGTNYSTAHFYLVTGSGMRSSPLYEEANNNRLYSIIDRWVFQAPYRLDANGDRVSDYNYVTASPGSYTIITADESVIRDISDTGSTTTTEYGFFKPMEPGEKILEPTRIHRNRVFTNSYVPPLGGNNVGAGCNFDVGKTRLYITSLPDGDNAIPDSIGGQYIEVGDGLLSGGQIIDTGDVDAPFFLIDKQVYAVKDLIAPTNTEVFRKFQRTGWVEFDAY